MKDIKGGRMRQKINREALIRCYRDALNYFDEEGRCDICDIEGIPVKNIITTDENDALVSDTWYCLKCYKKMMRNYKK